MKKQTHQEVMWLFHELGRGLRSSKPDAPEGSDAGTLLKTVIEEHQPRFLRGRNPFNWLKELQTTLNFWHHLQPESEVPESDIWRDLDTLDRVAKYLGLDPEFVDSIHGVSERIRIEQETEDSRTNEDEIRSWIREEVTAQIERAFKEGEGGGARSAGGASQASQTEKAPPQERGEHADRVRDFVIDNYIEPARSESQREVRVRAGDVDKALGYRYRRLPLICSALRSQKFLVAARARLLDEVGPPSGASTTTTFRYELE
jgi:hypothetical protein